MGILFQLLVMNLQKNKIKFKHNENWGQWDVLNVHPKATKLTHVKKKIRVKSFDFCTVVKRHFLALVVKPVVRSSLSLFFVRVSLPVCCGFFNFLLASLTQEASNLFFFLWYRSHMMRQILLFFAIVHTWRCTRCCLCE